MCGMVGIKPFELYYQMTFREAMNMAIGYNKKLKSDRDYLLKLMRIPYTLLYNVHNPKSQKLPHQLLPIDGEEIEVKQSKNYVPLSFLVGVLNKRQNDG